MFFLLLRVGILVLEGIGEISKNNPAADAANFKEWIDNNNLKKTGTETLEGYKCDIFEGDVKIDDDQPPVHMKIWHTPELGYPIRQESTLPQPMGKISSHLKNIQLESQAGSLFEIPAGYSQAKDVQEAMGMPSFGNGGKGQAPSQEEMQKMMKDMMKKMGQE